MSEWFSFCANAPTFSHEHAHWFGHFVELSGLILQSWSLFFRGLGGFAIFRQR
jgi:hypothetical protein